MPTPRITTLRIQGFKSLVDVQLQPRQLNIFIGKPNVGKSNILEALSLLGAGYSQASKFMSEFIRYEEPSHLFRDGSPDNNILIESNIGSAWLGLPPIMKDVVIAVGPSFYTKATYHTFHTESAEDAHNADGEIEEAKTHIRQVLEERNWPISILTARIKDAGEAVVLDSYYTQSVVRKYDFAKNHTHSERLTGSLVPPNGDNLFEVIKASKKLRQEAAALFANNQQQLVLRMVNRTLETQRNIAGDVYSYPWASVADTFQRLIFYLAAIDSNLGSVLLFEEPEAHSFPTYITQLAERIAEDVRAARNQYFITTHSPYLLDQLLENTSADQVAVFVVDYSDYQTTIKQVPDDQIGHLLDLSSDVFFNLNRLPLSDADTV